MYMYLSGNRDDPLLLQPAIRPFLASYGPDRVVEIVRELDPRPKTKLAVGEKNFDMRLYLRYTDKHINHFRRVLLWCYQI